jgi:hypothetical protein
MKIYFAGSRLNINHEKNISFLSKRRLFSFFETFPDHMAHKSVRMMFQNNELKKKNMMEEK